MLPRIRLRLSGMAFVRAVLLSTITLLPVASLAQRRDPAGRRLCRRGSRASGRAPAVRRSTPTARSAASSTCARRARRRSAQHWDRRAATQAGHRRRGRPGVRRGARRRQPAQHLPDRDLGLRPASRAGKSTGCPACGARAAGPARSTGSTRRPATRRARLPQITLNGRPEYRRRARQHRL